MNASFKKICYDNHPAYNLHHTTGMNAEMSTIDHLHLGGDHMMFYFLHGSGQVKAEGKTYQFSDGDVVILSATELFHCMVDKDVYHERIVLHINEAFLKEFSSDISGLLDIFKEREPGSGNLIPADAVQSTGLAMVMEEMLKLAQRNGTYRDVMIICQIVKALSLLEGIGGHVAGGRELTENPLVDKVIGYINRNYHKDITMESMAEEFNISSSYMSHLFKEHTGLPLWKYVILRRIQQFNLLTEQGWSIEAACYKVGFKNYSNFFRLYRKYMGMSPAQFRRNKGAL